MVLKRYLTRSRNLKNARNFQITVGGWNSMFKNILRESYLINFACLASVVQYVVLPHGGAVAPSSDNSFCLSADLGESRMLVESHGHMLEIHDMYFSGSQRYTGSRRNSGLTSTWLCCSVLFFTAGLCVTVYRDGTGSKHEIPIKYHLCSFKNTGQTEVLVSSIWSICAQYLCRSPSPSQPTTNSGTVSVSSFLQSQSLSTSVWPRYRSHTQTHTHTFFFMSVISMY